MVILYILLTYRAEDHMLDNKINWTTEIRGPGSISEMINLKSEQRLEMIKHTSRESGGD